MASLSSAPNGLRYLRWGGDGEAVQPEKGYGVGNCLRLPQNPQRQVHALLARFLLFTGNLFYRLFSRILTNFLQKILVYVV